MRVQIVRHRLPIDHYDLGRLAAQSGEEGLERNLVRPEVLDAICPITVREHFATGPCTVMRAFFRCTPFVALIMRPVITPGAGGFPNETRAVNRKSITVMTDR